jgi:outer membrane receptor for ferrienterochelin and colicins
VPHYAGVIDEKRLETSPSFVTWDAGVSRELGAWGARTVTLTLNGRNLTNAYQADLDQGPLRDAAYVYGPRFPRSIAVGLRFSM